MKVLVVGVGNPDRGDDGVGLHIAQSLAGRVPADVRVVARRDDLLSLIDEWRGVDLLVCVDAAAPSGCPGRIHRIDGALPDDGRLVSSHAFGLAETIALARVLGVAPPRIVVFAVEGACFDVGAAMTPEVVAACDVVAGEIATVVAEPTFS